MGQILSSEPDISPTLPSVATLIDDEVASGNRILTPLGRTLLEARRTIERNGELAADQEEVERDKADRRGVSEVRL